MQAYHNIVSQWLYSPFHWFLHPLHSGSQHFDLCFYESVFVLPVFCFFNSTGKWNPVLFAFLWLISLTIIPFKSIRVVTNGKILFIFSEQIYIISLHVILRYYVYSIYLGLLQFLLWLTSGFLYRRSFISFVIFNLRYMIFLYFVKLF